MSARSASGLGLRENLAQFSLLVAVNAFVGAMVGLERSTLPLIGEDDFGLASSAAVLSFIVAFGLAKALTNLGAGALAQRLGRRRLLIAGWAVALPVPLLIAVAPSWAWIVAANVLLGVNQGLAWSMTVVMKIDLVGPKRRGSRPAASLLLQAGLVNNLNDGVAWGVVPLFLAANGASVSAIGLVAGLYPAVWGLAQIVTGAWSDRVGRKPLIVAGMLLEAVALAVLAVSQGDVLVAALAAVMLGAGTALVYPTLIAAISDHVAPIARASTIGVYRFWRDMGYVVGGLVAGVAQNVISFAGAIGVVAVLTGLSGLWVAVDLPGARTLRCG